MAEYMSREAAFNAITDLAGKAPTRSAYEAVWKSARALKKIPAANVAPVRHAEWVVCGDGDNVPWMCSHCGKTTAHKYKVIYGKYCPNCGAMMDGGADHEAD